MIAFIVTFVVFFTKFQLVLLDKGVLYVLSLQFEITENEKKAYKIEISECTHFSNHQRDNGFTSARACVSDSIVGFPYHS